MPSDKAAQTTLLVQMWIQEEQPQALVGKEAECVWGSQKETKVSWLIIAKKVKGLESKEISLQSKVASMSYKRTSFQKQSQVLANMQGLEQTNVKLSTVPTEWRSPEK